MAYWEPEKSGTNLVWVSGEYRVELLLYRERADEAEAAAAKQQEEKKEKKKKKQQKEVDVEEKKKKRRKRGVRKERARERPRNPRAGDAECGGNKRQAGIGGTGPGKAGRGGEKVGMRRREEKKKSGEEAILVIHCNCIQICTLYTYIAYRVQSIQRSIVYGQELRLPECMGAIVELWSKLQHGYGMVRIRYRAVPSRTVTSARTERTRSESSFL